MQGKPDVVMLDVRSAAALAERTPETVRRWVWAGRLQARRDGRRLLVDRDDVLRLSGQPFDAAHTLSLRAWAAEARQARQTLGAAETARDLVLADRAARSAGGGG